VTVLLFLSNLVLTICVVILFLVVRDHEHTIAELESLLRETNDSISTNTTIIRNHTDILNELKEDIKILNNEVF
jgi:hypothetical protein